MGTDPDTHITEYTVVNEENAEFALCAEIAEMDRCSKAPVVAKEETQLTNLLGQWLPCQANGSNVCRALRLTDNDDACMV